MLPVAITYQLTLPEFMTACNAHWVARKQGSRLHLIQGLIACVLGMALWPIHAWCLILVLPGAALILMVVGRSILWRRAFHQARKFSGEISIRFTDEIIHVETIDGVSELKWSIYCEYLDIPDFVLLYLTPQSFSVIPKSAFLNPIDRQNFINLVNRKLRSVI